MRPSVVMVRVGWNLDQESEGAWLYSHVSQVEDENRSSKASWVILGC